MPFRNFMRIFVGLCFLKSPYSVFIRALKLHVGLLTDLTPEATSGVLQHHAKMARFFPPSCEAVLIWFLY